MKSITFDGRIGANGAEVRQTKGGRPYIRFSVANNSFTNGQEKTEWFDVTCYDQFIIENRTKFLTKGTYVIVQGTPNSEINVDRTGKVWLNQYVNAISIELPSFKRKDDENTGQNYDDAVVSTYTGNTSSQKTYIQEPEPSPATTGYMSPSVHDYEDDDLPF